METENLYYFFHFDMAVYYHLSRQEREIVDDLQATEGTFVNWRMMESIIQDVDNLDFLVTFHRAGLYDQGTAVAVVHTLN